MPASSAEPNKLIHYSILMLQVDQMLWEGNGRLQTTLEIFDAACTERRVSVMMVSEWLSRHIWRTGELDSWVGQVGEWFTLADSNAFPNNHPAGHRRSQLQPLLRPVYTPTPQNPLDPAFLQPPWTVSVETESHNSFLPEGWVLRIERRNDHYTLTLMDENGQALDLPEGVSAADALLTFRDAVRAGKPLSQVASQVAGGTHDFLESTIIARSSDEFVTGLTGSVNKGLRVAKGVDIFLDGVIIGADLVRLAQGDDMHFVTFELATLPDGTQIVIDTVIDEHEQFWGDVGSTAGSGIGAAGGAKGGCAVGGAVGGPIGCGAGGIIGGIFGGWLGGEVGEDIGTAIYGIEPAEWPEDAPESLVSLSMEGGTVTEGGDRIDLNRLLAEDGSVNIQMIDGELVLTASFHDEARKGIIEVNMRFINGHWIEEIGFDTYYDPTIPASGTQVPGFPDSSSIFDDNPNVNPAGIPMRPGW